MVAKLVTPVALAALLGLAGPARALCLTKSGMVDHRDREGAFNNRGLAHLAVGDADKALQDLTWAIEEDPDWGTAYLNRGRIYLDRQDWAKAQADCDKAVRLPPSRERAEARTCSDQARGHLSASASP